MARLPFSKHLNFNAIRRLDSKKTQYKRIKSFKKLEDAEEYLESWKKDNHCSKRFPPFIEETSIGLRLGFIYRICVPNLK